jgi:hypothetical protein
MTVDPAEVVILAHLCCVCAVVSCFVRDTMWVSGSHDFEAAEACRPPFRHPDLARDSAWILPPLPEELLGGDVRAHHQQQGERHR